MEITILEVALALVTVYLVLALLASQITEQLTGLSRRRSTLTSMVEEAFGSDSRLVDRFFEFGPVFALSKGNSKPSAIPPDLFASAFLATINGGKAPREEFRTPSEFVSSIKADAVPQQLLESLRTHLGGTEGNWDAFQKAIATWFADIGDRADGWAKRGASWRMLLFSLLLAGGLNVDTLYLTKSLFRDSNLRSSLANIGQQIHDTQSGATATPSPADSERQQEISSDAERGNRASADLVQALYSISSTAGKDGKVAGFGNNIDGIRDACARPSTDYLPASAPTPGTDARNKTSDGKPEWYASNPDAWQVLIPYIQRKLDQARFGVEGLNELPPKDKDQGSNDQSLHGYLDQKAKKQHLIDVLECAIEVNVWIGAARGATDNETSKANLKKAADAVGEAMALVHEQLELESRQHGLLQRFIRDPQSLRNCAEEFPNSRSEFDQCLDVNETRVLPIGWPPMLDQFNTVGIAACSGDQQVAAQSKGCSGNGTDGGFDAHAYPKLGLPSITVRTDWIAAAVAVAGWIITAIFVSLGAPFWFDALGRIVNLRQAGKVRKLADDGSGGAENAGRKAPGGPMPASPANDDAPPPFDSARNEFERTLKLQEIVQLQHALGTTGTGNLDEVTRQAIADHLQRLGLPASQELSAMSYQQLTGRAATAIMGPNAPSPSDGPWTIGRQSQDVKALIDAMNKLFTTGWTALSGDVYTYDVRARMVLYRLRMDPLYPQYTQMDVVTQARNPGSTLNRLDQTVRQAILDNKYPNIDKARTGSANWLDLALGELGITEDGAPAQSNARVVEYLKSLGVDPIQGDDTPWCGAFAGWVLQNHTATAAIASRQTLLAAAAWKNVGNPIPPTAQPMPGDICVLQHLTSGQHHVAFWMGQDATRLWLLGGNQGPTNAGAVTLVPFRLLNYTVDYRRL